MNVDQENYMTAENNDNEYMPSKSKKIIRRGRPVRVEASPEDQVERNVAPVRQEESVFTEPVERPQESEKMESQEVEQLQQRQEEPQRQYPHQQKQYHQQGHHDQFRKHRPHLHHHNNRQQHLQNRNQKQNRPQQQRQQKPQQQKVRRDPNYDPMGGMILGILPQWEGFSNKEILEAKISEISSNAKPIFFNEYYKLPLQELVEVVEKLGVEHERIPNKKSLLKSLLNWAAKEKRPVLANGSLDIISEGGVLVFEFDNYAIREQSVFVSKQSIQEIGLLRGHPIEVQIHAPREGETCPFALKVIKVLDKDPGELTKRIPFEDLVPYYPTRRLFLETNDKVEWHNLSMRVVDILTPIGFGQRGLIVAPPRTGKTVLLQGLAHAIAENNPEAHLIVVLVDERPEEVTDFRRQVTKGEVISSTFDQNAESHVHAAEMVIEKARRMVEDGRDVIILLDSITRLARAYNAMMPSSGKILSGGVEASALQKPKRLFGSARNIEKGGSLTILGTALIDTGSRMDDVIFEEFKGTGNMELNLDRELVNKRLFPAIAMDKSGTRKEELLYHPDELQKIYALRRAMRGVPPIEAMEMLIQRIKKTKSNTEFLLGLNR